MKKLNRLIDVLGISEEEAMRALISAFASVQPGPFRQKMLARKAYGSAPQTAEIWSLLEAANFRCAVCGSHGDLTLDHIDNNTRNNRVSNLRVLCNSCNRGRNSRPVQFRYTNLRVYEAIVALADKLGRFPTAREVRSAVGIPNLGAACYLLRFFERKWGGATPLRKYTSRK